MSLLGRGPQQGGRPERVTSVSALSDRGGLIELAWDAIVGLVLGLTRLWSRNTALDSLFHAAWDISGGPESRALHRRGDQLVM